MPGILILAGVVATSTLVFFMDTIRRAMLEGPRIVVLASEARGLAPGADVWIAGSPSGRVTSVRFGDPNGAESERVVIEAVLYRTALPYLREGTTARIGSSALLAPVVLKLEPGPPTGGAFNAADTIQVIANQTRERFLVLASEGKGATDSLADAIARLGSHLRSGSGSLGRMRGDTALLEALPRMSSRAGELRAAIGAEGSLPRLLAGDSVSTMLSEVLGGLRAVASDPATAAVADTVSGLIASLERISSRLTLLDSRLQEGRGTAGRALHDDEIRRQQRLFRARLDSVRSELIRTPWRWLRFKLF
jgi:phospholipid/cholesterol/gamma-HCH transport system substrate-binding protein